MNKQHKIENTSLLIMGWMVSKLKLKGNQLIAFAILYSFCMGPADEYIDAGFYIKKWIDKKNPKKVDKAMNKLAEKELILIKKKFLRDKWATIYKINWDKIAKIRST